jgi:hypothetical protein
MSKIEAALASLCTTDAALRDEVLHLGSAHDSADCQAVFRNVRQTIFPTNGPKRVQEFCVSKGIQTSVEYAHLRLEVPELPDDPRPANTTWYDYLHPEFGRVSRIAVFRGVLEEKNIRTADKYDEWLSNQPGLNGKMPTVQNICDGYFGEEYKSFNDVMAGEVGYVW